jgi:SAM-dependent methyltransferase
MDLYNRKADSYFSNVRWDLIELVPKGDHNILEIGCGNGTTLKVLKEIGKAKKIYGIEINEKLSIQLSQNLDEFIIGDIESMDAPFEEKYFDYILFGDVLEHLIFPENILREYNRLLKDDGFMIVSVPNIRHFRILINLILYDKFEYVDAGILDKSHLRFFTKREIKRMFEKENLEITYIEPNPCQLIKDIDDKFFKVFRLLPGNSYFTVQYIIKARKKS